MNFTAVNVSLDVFGGVIMTILLLYTLWFCKPKQRLDRIFMLLCISNLMMLAGDIPNWLCEGFGHPSFPALLWWGILIQYLGGVACPLFYTFYIRAYLAPHIKLNRKVFLIAVSLSALGLLCVVINLFNGMFYRIDAQNFYHRGELWLFSQILPVIIVFINACVVLCYRRFMRGRDIFSLLCYNLLVLAAIIVQSAIYGLAVTYPAIAVAIFIIFLNIQSEQATLLQARENELEKGRVAVMLSQIQPHFLYNTLTSIGELCLLDPQKANTALTDFSFFLRGNMASLGRDLPISLEEELNHTKVYLSLLEMRFGERVKVVYDIQSTVFRLPSLSIQPLVENAVHYGICRREEGGTVTIATRKAEDGFQVIISDDGVGFIPSEELNDSQAHIGLENVRNRLRLQCGGKLTVLSTPGVGTIATLWLPERMRIG